MKYDLIVFGGGTAGVASAYIAGKLGVKTLLVEKSDVLGGSITQGLVIPVMKLNSVGINTDFYNALLTFAKKYSAQHTYIDGNDGWFNPELLKIVFDDMLKSVNCDVLFSSEPSNITLSFKDMVFNTELKHKLLSLYFETKYIVDATSNGEIFKILNCDFQNSDDNTQASSLRFIIGGADTLKFAKWLENYDKDRNVTTIQYNRDNVYFSTAYTWDKSKSWALTPIFNNAVSDGVLEPDDTAYFQIFSVPSAQGSIAVNAPRIILNANEDIKDPFVYSSALKQGRERIYRIYTFCKKYLPGFENSYISHISDILGVRESYRIKGLYTFTKKDIINPKRFDNIAFASDYPIDIHSSSSESDKLEYSKKTYFVPLECLISEKYSNLYAAGRIISSDFEAHAAIRTQLNCFSMGEAVSKDIAKKLSLI